MKTFAEHLKEYSKWRLKNKGSSIITKKELYGLREQYRSLVKKEKSESPNEIFRARLKEYVEWRKDKKGVKGKITEKEFNVLKESVIQELKEKKLNSANTKNKISLSGVVHEYRKSVALKENKKIEDVHVSVKELKALKENFEKLVKAGKLKEADLGMNPAPAAPAAGDPNAGLDGAVPGAAPAPMTPVDPTIVAQVQDAKNSIDALAAAVGVQSTDLNADIAAGVPAVDGMQQVQPDINQMVESNKKTKKDKLDEIRERIEARKKAIQENAAQDFAKKDLQRIGISSGVLSSGQENKGSESTAEHVVVPSANSLANGYTSGAASGETKVAKTWPTKATKTADTGGALQGAGASQKKIKESDCNDEKDEENKDKLEEHVTTVTDVYVNKFFEPKLEFSKLSEALKNGMLG